MKFQFQSESQRADDSSDPTRGHGPPDIRHHSVRLRKSTRLSEELVEENRQRESLGVCDVKKDVVKYIMNDYKTNIFRNTL